MTTIYLIRHAEYLNPRNIAVFRLPGHSLSEYGRTQMSGVAELLMDKNEN